MSKEQENFNSLSSELGNLKKSSGQYKSISKEMTSSQSRLTLLMNRSMKCFSQQQSSQQSKTAAERRNSLQDTRNRSSSNNRNSEPVKSTISNKTDNQSKTSKQTIQVQSVKSSSPVLQSKSSVSSNGINGVNGSKTSVVTSTVARLQIEDTGAGKMPQAKANDSNGLSNSGVPVNGNKDNNGVNGSNKSGPIHEQSNKFTSKSMDNISKTSTAQKIDVVKGLQTKPASKVVINADKQMIDLDSFTDRRNMLNELKKFDKELKPVASAKSDKVTEVRVNVAKSGEKRSSSNMEPKTPTTPGNKANLFGDIKLGKKPSELKQVKVEPEVNRNISQNDRIKASDSMKRDNAIDVSTKAESRNDVQVKQFDDLLKDVSESDSSNNDSPRDTTVNVSQPDMSGGQSILMNTKTDANYAASGEVTIDDNKTNSTTDGSEDTQSQSSEYSEDDSFVSEFHFSGSQMSAPAKETVVPKKQVTVLQTQDVTPKTQKPVQAQSNTNQAQSNSNHDNKASAVATPTAGKVIDDADEELVKDTRVKFRDWDPAKLLARLYEVKMMPDNVEDISHKFIGMEGLMEKLPMNKKKATLLKTWKRRFFRAKDGWLHYYESGNKDKPSDSLQLMGGKVEELGPRVLGVDDGRGKYLMVRVPTDNEYGQWKVALESQTADNVKATYVRPAPASIPHPKKKVVIIDIGSCAIRAGILGERATLPQVFFPSVVAIHKQTGQIVVGADALKPDVRKSSTVIQPIQPTNKVDKFNIDMAVMIEILKKVFKDLNVNQSQYLVMLSTPQNLGDKLRGGLMRILIDELHVRGVCMVQQSLLALYSYNATSGIIVDIGERMEILPIYDGLLIDHGVSRQAYGGTKIQDSLYISLLENRYEFNSPVEKYLVRYLAEQACYVTDNYKENKENCDKDADSYCHAVDLVEFDLPAGSHQQVRMDYACFKSPEGFFNTDLWEMDYKNLQKQIYEAIQQCPMDSRKQMYRSVYLSGGVTTIPGFAERLEVELRKLAPPAAVVEVHASPQRYHSAYIGACAVASMDVFEMSCVSSDEWKKMGVAACKKWGTG